MLRYIAQRLALGLVSLLLLSMIVYAAAQVLPGNPGRLVLGREATPAAVRQFNQELGYHDPLPVRYWHWLENAVRGDFGPRTTPTAGPSPTISCPRSRARRFLALYAFLLCVPISIVAGVIAAVRRGKPTDRLITISGLSLAVIPEFVLGAILVAIFGAGACSAGFPEIAGALIGASLPDELDSLFLPARRRSRSCSSATSPGSRARGRSRRSRPTTRAPRRSRACPAAP